MSTQRPLFEPPKEWNAPQGLPDLSQAKEIAIDLEPTTQESRTQDLVGQQVKVMSLVLQSLLTDSKVTILYDTRVGVTLMKMRCVII